jgi:hypothetical protein
MSYDIEYYVDGAIAYHVLAMRHVTCWRRHQGAHQVWAYFSFIHSFSFPFPRRL